MDFANFCHNQFTYYLYHRLARFDVRRSEDLQGQWDSFRLAAKQSAAVDDTEDKSDRYKMGDKLDLYKMPQRIQGGHKRPDAGRGYRSTSSKADVKVKYGDFLRARLQSFFEEADQINQGSLKLALLISGVGYILLIIPALDMCLRVSTGMLNAVGPW
ncbi:hypothetical protein [Phaeobacter sp. C3_T13_0]|uniref:hypothetical protein n=1 Tax=Phaeobacter cretensis TaxID=3342641 RepID=UPI0039BC5870